MDKSEPVIQGRRESKKAEKRERIRLVARKLLAERGYDAMTIRDVAKEARVALGTISLYASDKRDLSLMVFVERIDALLDKAIEASDVVEKDKILARLVAFFAVFYKDFHEEQKLARAFLQLNYYPTGMHGPSYADLTDRVESSIANIIASGRGGSRFDPKWTKDVLARHMFWVFSSAVRWWIADEHPDFEKGIEELTVHLKLALCGVFHSDDFAAGN